MTIWHCFEAASRIAATSVVSGLWQGLVLVAVVVVCLRLLPKVTAAIRFAVWTAVFAILAVLPFLHALASGGDGTHTEAAVRVDARWAFAVAILWIVVSLTRAIRLALSASRLRDIWKRATPVESADCSKLASAAALGRVQLCTSEDVDRPSVIGFLSPRILIPKQIFEGLTSAELDQIVLHELGHLRRGDDWINLLQKISLVLVPLNPALMWIERRLCFERELACDDDVLRTTRAPKAYATCLTNLAEQRVKGRSVVLSLGAWEGRSELARRVHSILRGGEGMGRIQARFVLGALVLSLVGGAAELSRCPEFVSFSSNSASQAEAKSLPMLANEPGSFQSLTSAHQTLLKASMPLDRAGQPLNLPAKSLPKRHRSSQPRVLLRSGQMRPAMRQTTQRWVVLTSWDESERPRAFFTVMQQRDTSLSYAAVPTPGGWLIVQL
jgi:beta-lactamase regulating signal transducer with metallopeptidase domain